MKVMAIISEYNPFHNGHAYQLATQKKELGCDGVIAVMSGSFVQRGEPAICDKWARAEMALQNGCDLVLELPVLYSLQSAEGFAHGAVSLLKAIGFEGFLAFGSEVGDLSVLQSAADIIASADYLAELRAHLQKGESYPSAVAAAFHRCTKDEEAVPLTPNDILGIEYIKAIRKTEASLTPAVIQRRGDYNAQEAQGETASALGIRRMLAEQKNPSAFMPPSAYAILKREAENGRAPIDHDMLGTLVSYALMKSKRSDLENICGVSEGMEKRLMDAAAYTRDFDEMAMLAKTKRYPLTRIRRALINCLLGITKADEAIQPGYARILGVNSYGGAILRELSKRSFVPFINKCADCSPKNTDAERMFTLDCLATDVYSLLYPKKETGKNGLDFYRSPVLIR